MSAICILDTSIICNLLRIPGKDQDADRIDADFAAKQRDGEVFLVPMAAIVETGNHIGQVANGYYRLQTARQFVKIMKAAISGRAPFQVADLDRQNARMEALLDEFEQWAQQTQSGLGDLTIKDTWERTCARFRDRRVYIWSLDHHLAAYDLSL